MNYIRSENRLPPGLVSAARNSVVAKENAAARVKVAIAIIHRLGPQSTATILH
jgi:hypothetical protein